MGLSEAQKVVLIRLITDKKNVLFGQYTPILTKQTKKEAWMDVLLACKTNGFDPTNGNGWEYLRNTVWPNHRNYTMKKRDALNKTGAGGGSNAKYSKVDIAVLECIGKDSAAVTGLNVMEAWASVEEGATTGDNVNRLLRSPTPSISATSPAILPHTSSKSPDCSPHENNTVQSEIMGATTGENVNRLLWSPTPSISATPPAILPHTSSKAPDCSPHENNTVQSEIMGATTGENVNRLLWSPTPSISATPPPILPHTSSKAPDCSPHENNTVQSEIMPRRKITLHIQPKNTPTKSLTQRRLKAETELLEEKVKYYKLLARKTQLEVEKLENEATMIYVFPQEDACPQEENSNGSFVSNT